MRRALLIAGCFLAIVAACAVIACFTFGYLACFASGDLSDQYFNAAMVSAFLALITGGASAMSFVGAAS